MMILAEGPRRFRAPLFRMTLSWIQGLISAGLYRKMSWAVAAPPPVSTVALRGDERSYQNMVAMRGRNGGFHDRLFLKTPRRSPPDSFQPNNERSARRSYSTRLSLMLGDRIPSRDRAKPKPNRNSLVMAARSYVEVAAAFGSSAGGASFLQPDKANTSTRIRDNRIQLALRCDAFMAHSLTFSERPL